MNCPKITCTECKSKNRKTDSFNLCCPNPFSKIACEVPCLTYIGDNKRSWSKIKGVVVTFLVVILHIFAGGEATMWGTDLKYFFKKC